MGRSLKECRQAVVLLACVLGALAVTSTALAQTRAGAEAVASKRHDAVGPVTTITSAPSDLSSSAAATFAFASIDGATFQCSLDGAAFAPCPSPQAYSSLPDGSHTFQVEATDALGTVGVPAADSWTIDTTPPDTTITSSGPASPTTATDASFSFASTEPATYACSLDGAAFAACTNPQAYSGLTLASHTFQVLATDAAGNADATPASYTWTVALPAPKVTAVTPADGSTNFSYNGRPTIAFSRAIDPSTLNASTVILRRQDGSQASAAVLYSSATLTATLVPLAPLDLSKTYTVVVTTAVKALGDGTPLDAQVTFSFSTTATADPVRVDAGGPGDGAFMSDRYYSRGAAIATAAPIANTTDPLLYQTQRVGTWANGIWAYTIPVPNGTYDVKLYFAEIQKWGPGQRRFNLDITATPANPDIPNLDIFAAAGGANRAYSVTIQNVATCGTGAIRINATALVDYPAIAGFEAIPDAPTVCSTSPANGASGVARSTSVSATFSSAVDPASITPTTFTLRTSAGALVPAKVSYDSATNRATLTPSDALASYTTYRASINGTSWTFSTGA